MNGLKKTIAGLFIPCLVAGMMLDPVRMIETGTADMPEPVLVSPAAAGVSVFSPSGNAGFPRWFQKKTLQPAAWRAPVPVTGLLSAALHTVTQGYARREAVTYNRPRIQFKFPLSEHTKAG